MKTIRLIVLTAILCGAPLALGANLEEGFRAPPRSARPTVFWPWINGNISREGIRADLEAMKRVGIGGATIFDLSLYQPAGPVRYGSDAWHQHVRYAMEVANELGMEVGLHNCPGWSQAGGPWITPETSMKMLVWSETTVDGGKAVKVTLPQPPSKKDFYRDVAVLAVPAEASDTAPRPQIETNSGSDKTAVLVDGDPATEIRFGNDQNSPTITFSYPQPVQRQLLRLGIAASRTQMKFVGQIQASEDGQKYRTLRTFNEIDGGAADGINIPFAPTTARHFRLILRADATRQPWPMRLGEARFLDVLRIDEITGRSALDKLLSDPRSEYKGADPQAIAPTQVTNLASNMKPDGSLNWEVPAGRWTLLRFGYTTTASTNHPAVPEGYGLEVDKFDPAAVEMHFHKALDRVVADAGDLAGRSFTHIATDSWEAGMQNWTARMPQLFQEDQGYDLMPWLPVLTGRAVSSAAESEAFLNDFRQTVGRLYAKRFYATMRKLANERKLTMWSEAYGGTLDEFAAAENVDVPMSEFWIHMTSTSARRATSLAHTTGKSVVSAEAFTSRPPDGRWTDTPGSLKPIGDVALTTGINRFSLHSFVHQPRADLPPGFTHSRYGTHFSRLNTWWEQSAPWLKGVGRAQFLLQQGHHAADVLYFRHEDLERQNLSDYPELPAGHRADIIALNQLRTATAKDGVIRLPTGATYRVIALPKSWNASLDALRELKRLADGGAAIVGPAPAAPARLADLRENNAQWKKLVAELWAKAPAAPLAERFKMLKLAPDFAFTADNTEATVPFIHRAGDGFDLYFLCNPAAKSITIDATFREAGGRLPELWNPWTGAVRPANSFQFEGSAARLRLALGAAESLFVVFRTPAPAEYTTALLADGKPLGDSLSYGAGTLLLDGPAHIERIGKSGQRRTIDVPPPGGARDITGPWTVGFQKGRRAPESIQLERLIPLSQHSNPGVRYFSGTATYESTFEAPTLSAGQRCFLDVGVVRDLAEVWINDKPAGTLWTAPWRLDITDLLASGNNRLRIAVTNTWVNRLIGDEQLPADAKYAASGSKFTIGRLEELPSWYNDSAYIAKRQRVTLPAWKHYEADSPLLPSGLIGPLRLTFAREVTLD